MVGEVKDQSSFLIGIVGAFPLGFVNYAFPLVLDYLGNFSSNFIFHNIS